MLSGLFNMGRIFSSDQADGDVARVPEAGESESMKLPLKSKNMDNSPQTSTPASTRVSEGLSPATTKFEGGSEGDFSSPVVVRNTFMDTPTPGDGDADDFGAQPYAVRNQSCPPDLVSAPSGSDACGQAQPMFWPRTASGDTLEQILGAAGLQLPGIGSSPEMPGASPQAKHFTQAPTFWPRTMSGDDLDFALRDLVAASPPVAKEAEMTPNVTKPTYWPRTLSGDDLDFAMTALLEASPLTKSSSGDMSSKSSAGSLGMATPASNKVCLSTSPAMKLQAPSPTTSAAARSPGGPPQQESEGVLQPPPPPDMPAPRMEEAPLPPPPDAPAAAPDAKVVSIFDTIPDAEVGSPERPTKGSWGHNIGKCKPCAFLHTKGCQNGFNCEFCHICGRGEKKRRQREKWQQQHDVPSPVAHAPPPYMHQVPFGMPLYSMPAYGSTFAPMATAPMGRWP